MTRFLPLVAGGFALAAISVATSAQEASVPLHRIEAQQASSADDDIKCAAWAAFIVGVYEDEDTQHSFSTALAYFLGRYEGATGVGFEKRLGEVLDEMDADHSKLTVLDDVCPPRMQEFGTRLTTWSEAVEAAQPPVIEEVE